MKAIESLTMTLRYAHTQGIKKFCLEKSIAVSIISFSKELNQLTVFPNSKIRLHKTDTTPIIESRVILVFQYSKESDIGSICFQQVQSHSCSNGSAEKQNPTP